MSDTRHVNHECTAETFRPSMPHPARWLDVEQDFELVRDYWNGPLTNEEWVQFRSDGYFYCAAIFEGQVISLAAEWRYSQTAWEVAGVRTIPEARRNGYGKSVVSFVTAHILASGRKATCLTMADNLAMQRTAESVGFYRAPRG